MVLIPRGPSKPTHKPNTCWQKHILNTQNLTQHFLTKFFLIQYFILSERKYLYPKILLFGDSRVALLSSTCLICSWIIFRFDLLSYFYELQPFFKYFTELKEMYQIKNFMKIQLKISNTLNLTEIQVYF